MKYFRLAMFYILMLVIPASNFASVIVASHCQTSNKTSHSMHVQMDENESMHMHSEDRNTHQDSSEHEDCECGCNGEINCSVSGCSAAALMNIVGVDTIHSKQTMYQRVATHTVPPDPNLLFRPPISLF